METPLVHPLLVICTRKNLKYGPVLSTDIIFVLSKKKTTFLHNAKSVDWKNDMTPFLQNIIVKREYPTP